MQPFRDHFLAGAAFADNQHGAAERGGGAGTLHGIEECAGLADELRGFVWHGATLTRLVEISNSSEFARILGPTPVSGKQTIC